MKIDNISDCGDQHRSAFFEKPGGMGSESDCLLRQFERTLLISDSEAGLKVEKSGGVLKHLNIYAMTVT